MEAGNAEGKAELVEDACKRNKREEKKTKMKRRGEKKWKTELPMEHA